MATGKPNPWGGGGGLNWALEAERAEAEELAAAEAAASVAEPQSFPSLKEAAKTKNKKKKGTTVSLSEFTTGTYVGPGGASRQHHPEPRGLTTDELLRLPTGPRERTAEELEQGRLGGGFRNFPSRGPRRADEDSSWGSGGGAGARRPGGFDEEPRRGPRGSDLDQMPSRADENDNWAAGKRSGPPPPAGRDSRDRYQNLGSMRADEVDNWSSSKKPVQPRPTGFGSGFRDAAPGGLGGDSDRWIRGVGMAENGERERERPRLVLDPPRRDGGGGVSVENAKARPNPFGSARPREEVLAEKGVDWKKADLDIEVKKVSRPGSSQSSRPSSAHSGRTGDMAEVAVEVEVKPKPKVNPFGDAKPREVLLEEKGKDWRKIDMELEHRAVDRPETEQEKLLKEEIEHLKKQLNKNSVRKSTIEPTDHAAEELAGLREQIVIREHELEQLIHELDDKVRFGQKGMGERRPGSGGSRGGGIMADRPSSRSSLSEESRGTDFMERPRSRGGTSDLWSRTDERRGGFHTGREAGFFGVRDIERPRIRDRW